MQHIFIFYAYLSSKVVRYSFIHFKAHTYNSYTYLTVIRKEYKNMVTELDLNLEKIKYLRVFFFYGNNAARLLTELIYSIMTCIVYHLLVSIN